MPRTRSKAKPQKKKQPQKHQEPQKKQKKQEESEEQAKPQQPQKTKQSVKAKKYKKKTYEQLSRINRSKYQRIFLLSAQRTQQKWNFLVQGTKGSQYKVAVSTQVYCACVDFRMHKTPCKHIYFIVTQVGQNQQLLDYFKNDRRISKNAYKLLDEQLTSRLKSRMEKPSSKDAKDIDLKDDTDCVICFSEMDKNTQPLEDCSTCKKYFHSQCISAWKDHNPSCPLCRGALVGGKGINDPLGKVIDIKL